MEELSLRGNHHQMVEFKPLEERVSKEKPELIKGLNLLKKEIGEDDFNTYINRLIDIKKNGNRVLIITGKERHRSLLLTRYYALLQKAFMTDNVTIVTEYY